MRVMQIEVQVTRALLLDAQSYRAAKHAPGYYCLLFSATRLFLGDKIALNKTSVSCINGTKQYTRDLDRNMFKPT